MKLTAITRTAAIVALLAAAPLASAQSMMGGGPQRSGFVHAEGPLVEPEILWERGLGVGGESATQPVFDAEGNLYFTGGPGEPPKTVLVSLSPDGAERWRREWPLEPGKGRVELSVPAVTRDGVLGRGFRGGWFRAFDCRDGGLLWERQLSPVGHPITSSPPVDEAGFFYTVVRGLPRLHKIDSRTGEFAWVRTFSDDPGGAVSSPTFSHDQKTIYLGWTNGEEGFVYAIDADSGEVKWAFSPEESSDHSFAWCVPIVGPDGTIYQQDEELGHVYAIEDRGRTFSLKWSYKEAQGGNGPRLPAVDEHAVYFSAGNNHPTVFALNLDGSLKWRRSMSEGTGTGGLTLGRSALYFGLQGTGMVTALDKQDGSVLWEKKVGFNPESGGVFSEGCALSKEGILVFAVDGTEKHPNEATVGGLADWDSPDNP